MRVGELSARQRVGSPARLCADGARESDLRQAAARRPGGRARRQPVSLRKGGGLVDAPGRWPVGAKGEYPFFEAHIRFGFVVYKARRSRAQSM
jgi:hypothetical protein